MGKERGLRHALFAFVGSCKHLSIANFQLPIVDWPVTNESSQIVNWQLAIGNRQWARLVEGSPIASMK